MTVRHVLLGKGADVVAVAPETSVAQAADVIARRRIGAVVVLDAAGRLVGIISERDVVRGLTQHGAALLEMQVADLMTHDVITVAPECSVEEALEIMDAGYFRHLPVRDAEGGLCGIVSIRDLVRFRIRMQQSDVDSLVAYVSGRGYATGHV
jgi:CBS domain-containing protein